MTTPIPPRGAELEIQKAFGGCEFILYAPPGMVWVRGDRHRLRGAAMTRRDAQKQAARIAKEGVMLCKTQGCEYCEVEKAEQERKRRALVPGVGDRCTRIDRPTKGEGVVLEFKTIATVRWANGSVSACEVDTLKKKEG